MLIHGNMNSKETDQLTNLLWAEENFSSQDYTEQDVFVDPSNTFHVVYHFLLSSKRSQYQMRFENGVVLEKPLYENSKLRVFFT